MNSNITRTAAVRGQQVVTDIEPRKRGGFYRFISMGGTLLIAVAGLTTATTVAAHANPLVNSTWTSIVNRNSSDCVDARAHGTANGTAIEQWPCNNGLN